MNHMNVSGTNNSGPFFLFQIHQTEQNMDNL